MNLNLETPELERGLTVTGQSFDNELLAVRQPVLVERAAGFASKKMSAGKLDAHLN